MFISQKDVSKLRVSVSWNCDDHHMTLKSALVCKIGNHFGLHSQGSMDQHLVPVAISDGDETLLIDLLLTGLTGIDATRSLRFTVK